MRSQSSARALAVVLLLLAPPFAWGQEPKLEPKRATTSVQVSNAWVRATPKGAKVAAAYLQISAAAGYADRLIAVKVDAAIAGTVELHDMFEDRGVYKMRRIDGVEVKGGAPAELRPGGRHVMLMDVKRPIAPGDVVRLTLVFEKAGEIVVDARVEPIGGPGKGSTSGSGSGSGAKGSH